MDDPRPVPASSPADWRIAAADAVTSPAELLQTLALDPDLPSLDYAHRRQFPLRVPRAFVARMRRGDPRDPLFLQVWTRPEEALDVSGFTDDAVDELGQRDSGGLIRKYQGRVLVMTTGACAIHCRYCFRRHFPYGDSLAGRDHWRPTLAAIGADRSLTEVILSGGDPLSLTDDKLAALADGLEAIPQLRRLRIHTRQPVVLPQRVDRALLAWLGRGRLRKIMVLHINHASEIDTAVRDACARLCDAGVQLLNQAVLLRGVNDSVAILAALSERLCEARILPYYIHQLDRVRGAAHFEVTDAAAAKLMRALTATLPGYLVPRLVREVAGSPAKAGIPWTE